MIPATALRRTLASVPRRALSSLATPKVNPSNSSNTSPIALSLQNSSVGTELRKRGISGAREVAQMDRETIIRLLHSLGTRHEVERYLRIFTNASAGASGKQGVLPQAKFAVLK